MILQPLKFHRSQIPIDKSQRQWLFQVIRQGAGRYVIFAAVGKGPKYHCGGWQWWWVDSTVYVLQLEVPFPKHEGF